MNVTLLVLTDGRQQCLARTLRYFDVAVPQRAVERRVVVNDSPDPAYREWVDSLGFDLHLTSPERRGFAGAIQAGWDAVSDAEYIFHLPDDFLFMRYVDIAGIVGALRDHPHLAQMAFRRQPWTRQEIEAGGVVEAAPLEYFDRGDDRGHHWLEHRRTFTTDPCIYPAWVVKRGWPQQEASEARFAADLRKDCPQGTCGIWGKRVDGVWTLHIGEHRLGTGY